MNSPGNRTGAIGTNPVGEAEVVHCPDDWSVLSAKLEVTRRDLATANRRIAALVQERKRSLLKISHLKTMATTDVLTELVNRRRFDQVLDADFALAAFRDEPLSVIMVDVDYFKFYNDSFGHPAGDFVLCVVARHLVRSARPGDVVARYGGDEFAILLRGAGAADAHNCAERYRVAISSFRWPKCPVSASFGVASRTPSIAEPAVLMEEADRALYHSKRGGRSRVVPSGIIQASETASQLTDKTSPSRIWTNGKADRASPLDRESVRGPNLQRGPRSC